MPDPSVVPWSYCWVGLALAVTGGLWAAFAATRPHRASVAIWAGVAVLAVGVLCMLAPPFINGTAFIAKALIEQLQPKQYETPDRTSGVLLTRSGP